MKPNLVLLHGFRGTHHGLQLIANALPEFDAIIPDLPGFGEGETLVNYNLEGYVQWLHGFLQKNARRPVYLLGHSFGSIVSAAYAARYPDTIERLILVNPIGAPALQGPKLVLTQLAVFYYWVGRKLPKRAASRWLRSWLVVQIMSSTMAKTHDQALRRFIHSQHHQHFSSFLSAQSVSQGFVTSISHNVREFAPSISTSTLLIAGDRDDITPLAKQRELAELFPHATLKVIKNVGHLTHYETPQEVAEFVHQFLS